MNITLTGIHLDITDAIHDYTFEKMNTLQKYISKDIANPTLFVELSKTTNHHTHGSFFKAEAHIHIKGKNVTLHTTEEDLYKAIDVLKDMLVRELASHKDKERSIFRRGAQKVKALFKKLD